MTMRPCANPCCPRWASVDKNSKYCSQDCASEVRIIPLDLERIARMRAAGYSRTRIAGVLGVSPSTVRATLRRAGLPTGDPRKRATEEQDAPAAHRCANPRCTTGRAVSSYSKYCSVACANEDRSARIDMSRVVQLRNAGHGLSQIGAALGVSPSAVREALRRAGLPTGRIRKHAALPDERVCPGCGMTFEPERRDQKYCDRDCFDLAVQDGAELRRTMAVPSTRRPGAAT